MKRRIYFIESNLSENYNNLKSGSYEEKELYNNLQKAFHIIYEKPLKGVQIPYSQIPKYYIKKYGIDNLWKFDLPHGWRLVYSFASDGDEICLIVEWFSHKQYE